MNTLRTSKNYKKDNGDTWVVNGKIELNGEVTKDGEEVDFGGGESAPPKWSDIQGKPSTFPPSTHNHDNLYYSKSEVDDMISGGSEPTSWNDIEEKPSTFPPSTHNHNDLYYSKSEVDDLIADLQSQIDGLGG